MRVIGKHYRSMFDTSNPEVILLYSYFAPHVRRLVYALIPSKRNIRSGNLHDAAAHSGSDGIYSTLVSKHSNASGPYLRQNQIPLSATSSDEQKPDILRKRRKPPDPNITAREPLQSGRRHYVNLLIVGTGETIDILFRKIC